MLVHRSRTAVPERMVFDLDDLLGSEISLYGVRSTTDEHDTILQHCLTGILWRSLRLDAIGYTLVYGICGSSTSPMEISS